MTIMSAAILDAILNNKLFHHFLTLHPSPPPPPDGDPQTCPYHLVSS